MVGIGDDATGSGAAGELGGTGEELFGGSLLGMGSGHTTLSGFQSLLSRANHMAKDDFMAIEPRFLVVSLMVLGGTPRALRHRETEVEQ